MKQGHAFLVTSWARSLCRPDAVDGQLRERNIGNVYLAVSTVYQEAISVYWPLKHWRYTCEQNKNDKTITHGSQQLRKKFSKKKLVNSRSDNKEHLFVHPFNLVKTNSGAKFVRSKNAATFNVRKNRKTMTCCDNSLTVLLTKNWLQDNRMSLSASATKHKPFSHKENWLINRQTTSNWYNFRLQSALKNLHVVGRWRRTKVRRAATF